MKKHSSEPKEPMSRRKKVTIIISSIVAFIVVCVVVITPSVVLTQRDGKVTASDIFKSFSSDGELTSSKLLFTLPVGWEIYIPSSSNTASDFGYIKDINGFVVSNGGTLSIVKCDDKRVYVDGGMPGMLFPLSVGISSLRVKDGLIVCKFNDGRAGAFDYNGKTVVSRNMFKDTIGATSIDAVIKILGSDMIAAHANYENTGVTGYTSIIRPTQGGGEVVTRVKNNDNALKYVTGFDNKYVSVVGNSAGSYMYEIPDSVGQSTLDPTANGTVVGSGQSEYYSEVTYIGGGRFFVHEDWEVKSTDDYIYKEGDDYVMMNRSIYTPHDDKLTPYTANADKVFLKLSNNYYDMKDSVSTSSYLNDGYTYASYCLSIEQKIGFYDQFILDSDLNVVMSLTGNYGVRIGGQEKDKVSYFDLIMTCVDGYFYTPIAPSEINIYDKKGNLVGHNNRSKVAQQELANGVMVAGTQDPDNANNTLYGAFNIYGEEIIPFKYTSLSSFRGDYTIGERYGNGTTSGVKEFHILAANGVEQDKMSDGTTPLSDMAADGNGKAIYKIGCYMYKQVVDGTTRYGIKNFNPNVDKNIIMPASMQTGSVLYSPSSSPSDVFVFEKLGEGTNVTYAIYKLV